MTCRVVLLLAFEFIVVAAGYAATTIDILVAYDQSAATWLAAEDREPSEFAAMAVRQMNEALPATGLDKSFSFHLAGAFVCDAEASGAGPESRLVDAITSVCDGVRGSASRSWKDIQSARESCKADIVVVLIDSRRSGSVATGGVSWQMGQGGKPANPQDFAKFAYAVCGVEDIEGTSIMTHEVGHLMGAGHSDELEGDPGPQQYKYSSAFYFSGSDGAKYTTIMGYPYKTSSDFGYKTVPCFSSSAHTWKGLSLGDGLHDNTRTLRETCVSVAQFRISGNEGLPVAAAFAAKTVVNARVNDANGDLAGLVQITVAKTDKKGLSKVSAVYYKLDGKKNSAKAVKASVISVDGVPTVRKIPLAVKGQSDVLVVSVGSDGTVTGRMGACEVQAAGGIGVFATDKPRFVLKEIPATIDGFPVIGDVESDGAAYHLLPDGDGVGFSVNGKKWSFAKAASVKYVKDKATGETALRVDTGKTGEKSNLCGLKLSVNAKTGVFKGSFAVYAASGTVEKPKLKKYKFTVTGLLVDGHGTGQAVCKKIGLYSVAIGE